jgi:hypothetical protein
VYNLQFIGDEISEPNGHPLCVDHLDSDRCHRVLRVIQLADSSPITNPRSPSDALGATKFAGWRVQLGHTNYVILSQVRTHAGEQSAQPRRAKDAEIHARRSPCLG